MSMVEWKKLGELGCFENIGTDKKIVDGEQLVTLLNYVDVYHHKYIDSSVPQMQVSASDKKIRDCTVEQGDIFVTPSSETVDDIGHSSVIVETIPNAVYSYHIMRYRLFERNMLLSYYINYAFDTDYVKRQILKKAQGLTRFGLSKDKFASIEIPLPSLSEQERIVGILDTFTSSIENLKAQISLRRKQYEHYRDKLLDLEGKPGVEIKTLGEVCEISGDYGLSAPSKPYDGVRYLRITDITDSGGLNNEYVSADLKEDAGKEPLVDGDILFARTGATVGKTLVYRSNFGKCLFAGYLIRYRARKQVVFPQYLFHFTHSTKYYNWVSASLAVGAQPNISAQRYNQLQFPLPSLEEQSRIVSILDEFEASIKNLEAQLEAREKQYEYYREKLLTFERE